MTNGELAMKTDELAEAAVVLWKLLSDAEKAAIRSKLSNFAKLAEELEEYLPQIV